MPVGDPQRGEITERIASSIYKQGEQARAAGQLDVAVDHFLRVGAGRSVVAGARDGASTTPAPR